MLLKGCQQSSLEINTGTKRLSKNYSEDSKRILRVANSLNAIKHMNMIGLPYLMGAEVLLHEAVRMIELTKSEVNID